MACHWSLDYAEPGAEKTECTLYLPKITALCFTLGAFGSGFARSDTGACQRTGVDVRHDAEVAVILQLNAALQVRRRSHLRRRRALLRRRVPEGGPTPRGLGSFLAPEPKSLRAGQKMCQTEFRDQRSVGHTACAIGYAMPHTIHYPVTETVCSVPVLK